MTIDCQALEHDLTRWRAPHLSLQFNYHVGEQENPHNAYRGYRWLGEVEMERAFETGDIWTLEIDDAEPIAACRLVDVVGERIREPLAAIQYQELDYTLRAALPNRRLCIRLCYNAHVRDDQDPFHRYGLFSWRSDAEWVRAIETNMIWTVELFGPGIEPSLLLAAPSLGALIMYLKGNRDVILSKQRRKASAHMSARHISDLLMRSAHPPTFAVERKKRRRSGGERSR